MTRKDCMLIAEIFSNVPASKQKDEIVLAFAKRLQKENPNFNWNKFVIKSYGGS